MASRTGAVVMIDLKRKEHRLDRYETEIAELRHTLEKIRTTADETLTK